MKRRRLFETLTAALLAVLMIAGGFALAQPPEGKGGGKNKDDGGGDGGGTVEPVLPSIEYRPHYVPMPDLMAGLRPTLNNINNWSDCVGYCDTVIGERHAWWYDSIADMTFDLNDLDIPKPIELEGTWVIASAVGINDLRAIVGYLSFEGERRSC